MPVVLEKVFVMMIFKIASLEIVDTNTGAYAS